MKNALLMIHGFLTDDKDFGRLYDFVKDRYTYVKPILIPGHGEGKNLKNFTVEATIDYVIKEFDKLQAKCAVVDIIGFSMGGALATYLSTKRQFRNLILLAPANKYLNPKMPFAFVGFYYNKIKLAQKKNDSLKSAFQDLDDELEVYKKNDRKSADLAMKRLFPNYNYHTLSTFMKVIKECNKDLVEIKNPTLILWGKLDQLVPYESCEGLYHMCKNPKSHFDVIPDISHLMLFSENDEWLISKITTFMDQNRDDDTLYTNAIEYSV